MNKEKVIESLERLKDIPLPPTTKEDALRILIEMRDNEDFCEFMKELAEARKRYKKELREWLENNE